MKITISILCNRCKKLAVFETDSFKEAMNFLEDGEDGTPSYACAVCREKLQRLKEHFKTTKEEAIKSFMSKQDFIYSTGE